MLSGNCCSIEHERNSTENVPPLTGKPVEQTNPQEFDLFDGSRTENNCFAYPLTCNPGVVTGAVGPHPKTIVLLTADAFGVSPVSILSPDEAMYHFVTGLHQNRGYGSRCHKTRRQRSQRVSRPVYVTETECLC